MILYMLCFQQHFDADSGDRHLHSGGVFLRHPHFDGRGGLAEEVHQDVFQDNGALCRARLHGAHTHKRHFPRSVTQAARAGQR